MCLLIFNLLKVAPSKKTKKKDFPDRMSLIERMAVLRAYKQALRKELKCRLTALSAAEKQRQSRLLSYKLFKHPKYISSQRIAVFLSMDDEVCTEEIIKDLFNRGKSCFIPRYRTCSSHMDMLKLNSLQDLETLALTSWNIRQPAEDCNSREEALSSVPVRNPSSVMPGSRDPPPVETLLLWQMWRTSSEA
ncbi:5,10-methenyltetrahydrofolate synthetase (5-formyltetrahydrofolate cyclo-ligase) isoform X2 [Girardinichthys multiradiatus]|uniref:5,10-methenyltetrahydrofolate synthetase (5-formyltetrahydrofolate cyclo-ligase) isoform X2 n=1 Tax=Girardinichthys multiradiatus TaxID=208333 RepID=UPI001FAD90F2|nr:5,10-methenyltetrahydrofolate synthetase (5-formyltetrahydrofolate cyclo-ligase) isoform X2 [Girardinichthys multiradiatus]